MATRCCPSSWEKRPRARHQATCGPDARGRLREVGGRHRAVVVLGLVQEPGRELAGVVAEVLGRDDVLEDAEAPARTGHSAGPFSKVRRRPRSTLWGHRSRPRTRHAPKTLKPHRQVASLSSVSSSPSAGCWLLLAGPCWSARRGSTRR